MIDRQMSYGIYGGEAFGPEPYQDEFDTYAAEAAVEQRSVEDMELDQYRDEARANGEVIPF
jgi:hypothetical protein